MNIVLVGGGKAAVTLLNYFSSVQDIRVVGVVDLRQGAPGILLAKQLGIETTSKMEDMLGRPDVDVVIEITGVPKVRQAVIDMLRPDQEVMSAGCAKMMCDMIDAQIHRNTSVAEEISVQFEDLTRRLRTAIQSIDSALQDIDDVLRDIELVTINARIEAARAGEAGRAFSVVVEEMQRLVTNIRNAMNSISHTSEESHKTLENLHNTEDNLWKAFQISA